MAGLLLAPAKEHRAQLCPCMPRPCVAWAWCVSVCVCAVGWSPTRYAHLIVDVAPPDHALREVDLRLLDRACARLRRPPRPPPVLIVPRRLVEPPKVVRSCQKVTKRLLVCSVRRSFFGIRSTPHAPACSGNHATCHHYKYRCEQLLALTPSPSPDRCHRCTVQGATGPLAVECLVRWCA